MKVTIQERAEHPSTPAGRALRGAAAATAIAALLACAVARPALALDATAAARRPTADASAVESRGAHGRDSRVRESLGPEVLGGDALAGAGVGALSFEERVRAQEALERVAWSHRIGATRRFEEAFPREALERAVRAGLERSLALETRWKIRITSTMLQDEIDRMITGTRMPDRLREVFAALHDDPRTIRECLARPVLAERLLRAAMSAAGDSIARAGEADSLPRCSGPDGTGQRPSLLCPEARQNATAVWTGNVMIVWGGAINFFAGPVYLNTGGRYDPVTDTWSPTSTDGAPEGRHQHSAIWTGEEMIVWGGTHFAGLEIFFNDGGRYDPETDTWTPVVTTGAPVPRSRHTAVWTGDRMLVWGGSSATLTSSTFFDSGGRYDPASGTWTPIASSGAPSPRAGHTAVWTGSDMIVWGGYLGSFVRSTGGRYDPAADAWTPTATDGAPQGRRDHRAVWTGEEMIVWGGYRHDTDDRFLASGGRYDPGSDSWSPTATSGAPEGRVDHTAVWTGSEMLVWGGRSLQGVSSTFYDTGGGYDPGEDAWTPTSTVGAPFARSHHAAVAAGSRMIVWGGFSMPAGVGAALRDGAVYDPESAAWTTIDPACPLPACADVDEDGYAGCSSSCNGEGRVCGDCDDAQNGVNPLGDETAGSGVCADGADNDCDGSTDGADPGCALPVCPDSDGDGYAVCGAACDAGATPCGDCNDGSSAVSPAAPEGSGAPGTCSDTVDNDCDGGADSLDPGCLGPLVPAAGTVIGPTDPIPTFQWNAAGATLTRVVFSDRPSLRGLVYRPTNAFGASEMLVPTAAQWAALLKKLASGGRTIVYWGIEIKDGRVIRPSGALALTVRAPAVPVSLAPADGSEYARAGPIPTFRWDGVVAPKRLVIEFAVSAFFSNGLKAYVITPETATEWTPTAARWKAITGLAGKGIGAVWWRVTVVDTIGRTTHGEPTLLGIN